MKKFSLALIVLFMLTSCGGGSGGSESTDTFSSKEELGKSLFFDQNLSLTRNTSCATCHDPEHAFIDARFSQSGTDQTVFINGALSVGDDGFSLGGRNTPTASYAMFSPTFDATTVRGGQFHDGRAATLKDQAMAPPLDSAEMQMADKESVLNRIKENDDYVTAFKTLYGNTIFDDVNVAYEAMGEAISEFEKTDTFAPFDSKYDRYLLCKENGGGSGACLEEGNWTTDEELGLSLFFSQANTNCAVCHQLKASSDVAGETFSDYSYHNIGTPQNLLALQARARLGLGEIDAVDHGGLLQGSADGAIKVPTLRNVAVTAPYMHNGVFADLTTVLEFYEHQRGGGNFPLNPETNATWGDTDVIATVNTTDLIKGKELTARKIEGLEAFLRTLTDAKYESLIP